MDLFDRTGALLIAAVAAAILGTHPAAAVDPLNPSAPCSVFDPAPCTPSFCGVYGPWPCVPALPSIGSNPRITIQASPAPERGRAPEAPVDSLREVFAALRTCFVWPTVDESFSGMEITIHFSFKRSGELLAPPRVTYTNRDASPEIRRIYREAINAAFDRCTPMPFTDGMAGAVAGRPLAIRFFDNR